MKQKRLGVVVSAMGGKPKVTDMLLDLVSLAAAGKVKDYTDLLSAIEKKHMDSITVRALQTSCLLCMPTVWCWPGVVRPPVLL